MLYKWNKEIPLIENEMIYIDVDDTIIELDPSTTYQSYSTTKGQKLKFKIEKSIYYEIIIQKEK
ncbi:MAG: hypothetical protein JKY48_11760 [Flavobacteriales bacterium]|nr:hypothetical protein [Flavobacteriales bacterium]